MSMIKIIGSDSWDFGNDTVSQIKVASKGLTGDDYKSFVKKAGHYLADIVRNIEMKPGEIPIHMIALGSTESYSCNRNGDGFKEASCIKFHPTFEKFAKFYRNHNNRPGSPSYGIVKKSIYNPEMKRVELIVGLNGTKEAAERNGGYVADKELEKLEAGKDLGVSMSCKVAHDVCSWCGNKAKTRKEYCSEDKCGGGGLKNNIGALLKCGHVLHADNPEPVFFDISHVIRPADRTAYVTGVLGKEASSLPAQKLDEIFESQAPAWIPASLNENKLIKLARDLSFIEHKFNPNALRAAFRHNQKPVALPANVKVGHVLAALSNVGVILPVEEFLNITMDANEKSAGIAEQVRAVLPGVYGRLAESEYATNYLSAIEWPNVPSASLTKWATTYANDYAISNSVIKTRVDRGFFDNKPEPNKAYQIKNASAISNLASLYAAYTLKALNTFEAKYLSNDLTRDALLTQNYVC